MSKTILLPIDLNNPEISAVAPLNEALAMLGEGGRLHVLSVVPEFGMAQVSSFFPKGHEKELLNSVGATLKDWVNANVPGSVEVHPHVVHGTVYDAILRVADKLDVDVIVMGAHRPDLADYLLGPNAARVVRHAKQSVYVVRN